MDSDSDSDCCVTGIFSLSSSPSVSSSQLIRPLLPLSSISSSSPPPPRSPSSGPLSSLEPHPKRQRLERYPDANADANSISIESIESMESMESMDQYNEVTSLHHTTMGGKTATQPVVHTTVNSVVEKMMQEMVTMKQKMNTMMHKMDTTVKMIYGDHMSTTSGVIDAEHTATATATATAITTAITTTTTPTTTTTTTTPKGQDIMSTRVSRNLATAMHNLQDMISDNIANDTVSQILLPVAAPQAPPPAAPPTEHTFLPSPSAASGVLGITADAGVPFTSAPIPSSGTTSTCIDGDDNDDDDDEDSRDAMPSSPPLAVTHHDTQQFTITPIVIIHTTIPVKNNQHYPQIYVKRQHMVIPSMILSTLAKNPDILLPLASFRAFLFDGIHALNKKSFHLSCEPISEFNNIAKVTFSVVCSRIRYALNTMYPKAGIYDFSNDAGLEAMACELEKGPIDVLESIVKDGLAVWNPIRVLITHLEGVTMQYSRCTSPEERQVLRHHITRGYTWMNDIADMAVVYGHYLWDSQWVSDDEWDALVKHMKTLTTEIFPEAYSFLLKINSDPRSILPQDIRKIIDYFKQILGIISSCFLHQYRPIKKKSHIPYRNIRNTVTHSYTIPESVSKIAIASSTALMKQCVVEYMNHPTAFPQFFSTENLLQTTTTTDDYPSPRDYIISEVDHACSLQAINVSLYSPKGGDPNDTVEVYWSSGAPVYYGRPTSLAFYLTDRIIHSPPHDNPVYQKIISIYPTVVNRATFIGSVTNDPQFQKTPVYRVRDGCNP